MRRRTAAALTAVALLFTIGCGDRPADRRSGVFTSRGNSLVAYSPDGKTLASGGADQTVRIWDVKTGELIKTLK